MIIGCICIRRSYKTRSLPKMTRKRTTMEKKAKAQPNREVKDTKTGEEGQEFNSEDDDDKGTKKLDEEGGGARKRNLKVPEKGQVVRMLSGIISLQPKEELVEVLCPYTKPPGGAQRFGQRRTQAIQGPGAAY